MNISANPVAMLTQFAPMDKIPNPSTLGLSAAGVLRYARPEGRDAIKVSGAVTAPDLMPGSAIGAAITADGNLDSYVPESLKARVEFAADGAKASPAFSGYLALLKQHAGAIGAMKSNLDPAQMSDPAKALELLRSLSADEFIFGAQMGDRTILWRGVTAGLPAGVADVVRASDQLYGTLA